MEPLLTAEDVARFTRLHVDTIREWARDGRLPAVKVAREWRFRAADIEHFVTGPSTKDEPIAVTDRPVEP